jgi:hypothetical protein
MYENTIITEPKWKSWIIETTTPLLTPDQCNQWLLHLWRAQSTPTKSYGWYE